MLIDIKTVNKCYTCFIEKSHQLKINTDMSDITIGLINFVTTLSAR